MIRTSALAASIQPSATLAAGAKARALKQSGITVYDFSLGEPDFNTPAHICAAATDAMAKGFTHYTPTSGSAEVRKAIAEWYGTTYGYECSAENVVVSGGAKHSLHTALAAIVGPGDEVIIPTPYWVSYSDLVSMTGAKAVLVHTSMDTGFKLTPAQLQTALTPRTRILMLNSPSNPTGAVYSRSELEALLDVLIPTDVAVLSDEIYELLTYDDHKPTCVATLRPEFKERIITISGASKSYAMTGWRLGWTVAPKNVVKAMDTIQSQETSCPSSIAQHAIITALKSPETAVAVNQMRGEFDARRKLGMKLLSGIPGLKVFPPQGAFYLFFDVSAYFGKSFQGKVVSNSAGFCETLLEQAHVNLVTGSAFGAEGFARMSFATSPEVIEAGLSRFGQWLAQAN